MKLSLSIFTIFYVLQSVSAQEECQELEAQCSDDISCTPFILNATQCSDNSNLASDPYGCAIFNADSTNNEIYGASCLYNCFLAANSTSNSSLFTNVTDCVTTELVGDECQGQMQNCYNTNTNNLSCIGNLNTLGNCITNNLTLPGCSQANQENADTQYPAYEAQCSYSCNIGLASNAAFNQLYSCLMSDTLLFPSSVCTTEFQACLADSTGVCVGYLNTATIAVNASATCSGSTTNNSPSFVQACAQSTYSTVNVTTNSTAWSGLTNCLLSGTGPSPGPSPSSGSNSNSSSSGSNSEGSSSFSAILASQVVLLIALFSLFVI